MRNIDLIGVVDIENNELVWSWGAGKLDKQHHPTLLENGNVLIFDNRPIDQASRVFELNPLFKAIEWEYKAEPPGDFYSPFRGGNQRLSNGNTLITESDRGRVFEVTPGGQIVWEFYNPIVNADQEERAAIYRMTRISHPDKVNTE
jgi:hypothetical protein